MEISLTERRCDRCGKKLPARQEKPESDLVANLREVINLEYVDLCDMCINKAERLLNELGPVDLTRRGRRGGKPGKKEAERKRMLKK